MLTAATQWAKRLFAERHVVIRSDGRIRYLTLSRRGQIAALCIMLVGASAVARLAASHIVADRKMAHKQVEVELAEFSASDLRDLVMHLQDRLASANRELEQTRGRLASATVQNMTMRSDGYAAESRLRALDEAQATLQAERVEAQSRLRGAEEALNAKSGQIARLNRSLDGAKNDIKMTEEQRAAFAKRVLELEGEMQTAAKSSAQFKANWEQAQLKLQQLAADREKVVAERDGLLGRVAIMQQARMRADLRARAGSKLESSQVAAPPVAGDVDETVAEAAEASVPQVAALEPAVVAPARSVDDGASALGGGDIWRLL
jgi:chromosome segregation ATPase